MSFSLNHDALRNSTAGVAPVVARGAGGPGAGVRSGLVIVGWLSRSPKTRSAVRLFQKQAGLPADGHPTPDMVARYEFEVDTTRAVAAWEAEVAANLAQRGSGAS